MTKKLILATLAGAVVQFLLGWLIYGLILANFMSANSIHYEGLLKDMSTWRFMVLVFLSGLAMAFLIAYIFQRWGKIETLMKGLSCGMIIGFFVALSFDLNSYAMMHLVTKWVMVVDVIASTIMMGINGAVIAWILGYKSQVNEPAK